MCNMPQFKAFGMMNLQYEIRICQKSHNKVTILVYVMVRFLMKHTLFDCTYKRNLLFLEKWNSKNGRKFNNSQKFCFDKFLH